MAARVIRGIESIHDGVKVVRRDDLFPYDATDPDGTVYTVHGVAGNDDTLYVSSELYAQLLDGTWSEHLTKGRAE